MNKSRTESHTRQVYETAFRLSRLNIYMNGASHGLHHARWGAWGSYSWRKHTPFTGWVNKAREWDWLHHPYNEIPF